MKFDAILWNVQPTSKVFCQNWKWTSQNEHLKYFVKIENEHPLSFVRFNAQKLTTLLIKLKGGCFAFFVKLFYGSFDMLHWHWILSSIFQLDGMCPSWESAREFHLIPLGAMHWVLIIPEPGAILFIDVLSTELDVNTIHWLCMYPSHKTFSCFSFSSPDTKGSLFLKTWSTPSQCSRSPKKVLLNLQLPKYSVNIENSFLFYKIQLPNNGHRS